jgi:prepilin-type N-terminal cleavage/methylation domain-containing protein
MDPAPRGRRRAFSLVEIVVALAVILILAAVALPNVAGYLDQKKAEATAAQLAVVRDALFNPATTTDFYDVVGNVNAGRLSHLDSAIASNAVASGFDNSCGNQYTGGQRNNWPNGGPFMTFNSSQAGGMMTPIGPADDTLNTVGASGTTPRYLRIVFLNAKLSDAEALEMVVDGTATPNTGWNTNVVRWTPQAGTAGNVTLYYYVTINGTC